MGRPPTVGPKTRGAERTARCRAKQDAITKQLHDEVSKYKRKYEEEQKKREAEKREYKAAMQRKDKELFEMQTKLEEKRKLEMEFDIKMEEKDQKLQRLQIALFREPVRVASRSSVRVSKLTLKHLCFSIRCTYVTLQVFIAHFTKHSRFIEQVGRELDDRTVSIEQSTTDINMVAEDLERALGLERNGLPGFVSDFTDFVERMNDDSVDALVTDDGQLMTHAHKERPQQ